MKSQVIIASGLVVLAAGYGIYYRMASPDYHTTLMCGIASQHLVSMNISEDTMWKITEKTLSEEYDQQVLGKADRHFNEFVSVKGGEISASEEVWDKFECGRYF